MEKDAQRQKARRLRASGVPLKGIAKQLGLSESLACVYCRGTLPKYARAKYANRDQLARTFTELYRQGTPIPAIARQLNIPQGTLFDWRRRENLRKNPRSRYVTDNLRKKISNKLTVDPDGRLRAEAIRSYIDDQLTTPEIAAKLGVTSVTIGVWLQQAGIERRKSPTASTRQKLRAANLGAKRYNWKGGITGEQHRKRISMYMRQAREICFRRDDYTCRNCGQRGGKLNAHHIWPFQRFPELMYETWNLLTLCKTCHDAYHKAAGGHVKMVIGPFFDSPLDHAVKENSNRYKARPPRHLGYTGRTPILE